VNPLEAAAGAATRYTLPWLGKIALPWILAALAVLLLGVGTTGMYFGAQIEAGRNAKVLLEIKDAHIAALKTRTDQYLGAIARGDEIADRFVARLDSLKIENKTFNNQFKTEVERQVYIDCPVPDAGIELLQRRIDAANARMSARQLEKKP